MKIKALAHERTSPHLSGGTRLDLLSSFDALSEGMAAKSNTDRVTLAQVAERAGVSPAAVSQVLNEHPRARISASARERISRAVEELGYRPNMVARSLRMARSATFGFISDSVTVTRYATGILRGALRSAEEVDHLLLIAETGGDPERERLYAAKMVATQRVGCGRAASGGSPHPLVLRGFSLCAPIYPAGDSSVLPPKRRSRTVSG